ncbi:hypothetical protein CDL12_09399 [Handroanthus impetiginosus]|uniref:Uncharacterized protein n=1 Tax=Handroanthus impetiginosus TaxID=429701 RepID=A0A2G9HKX0_9LAMI|nr:hypothetical protein CDL12_09399 [Handroanthus impetiginosus]
MRALSKPISSPNRAEKFPPPLMRFLRSNVGSRSRGRSRSSPMFYLRSKKRVPGVIETTQEPSSPKVTCIGQVRVRRSSKSKAKKTGGGAANRRRRWWFKKTLCCGKISSRFRSRKRPFRRLFSFCKWGSFFRSGYCKKVDATEDSFRVYSKSTEKNENIVRNCSSNSESDYSRNKYENLGDLAQEIKRDFLVGSSSPPKNALLLTRCRSAPYRSSSLAGRFWGSPLSEEKKENEAENEEKSEESEKPKISEENSKKLEENSVNKVQDFKGIIGGGAVHPLLLTRCKSEPARTGERLIPEANFLREKRLD